MKRVAETPVQAALPALIVVLFAALGLTSPADGRFETSVSVVGLEQAG